jgi:3-hydroxypropanoate dehydrogenase
MSDSLNATALEQIFLNARTFSKFAAQEVSDELIEQLYDLMKWGPTSMNCQPGHFVVIRSLDAKKRLSPALMPGNQDKTMAAPVTIIVASDMQFYKDMLAKLPANPKARSMFESNKILIQQTAFRNGTLQGGYLIIAARMLGLDCGPMSGFDNDSVDAEFFPSGRYKSNFLVNIGFGDSSNNYPRGTRLSFEQAVDTL